MGESIMGKNYIQKNSKEIAESFLSTRSKGETAKAFCISSHGVERALYYQGLEEYISPSSLAIIKSTTKKEVERSVRVAEVPKSRPSLIGKQPAERGLELANARKWAFEYWRVNPDATPTLIQEALKDETGEIVSNTTIASWLRRWKKGRLQKEPIQPMPQKPSPKVTWEDIVQTAPDRLELASLLLDGFIKVLADQRQRIDELLRELDTANKTIATLSEQVAAITEDRKKVTQELNEVLVKTRSGGLYTLDQAQHILIPKQ